MISQLCCGLSTDQAVHWCCVSIHSRCVKQDATQPTDWWRPFGSSVLCLAQKRDTAWLLPELKMCPWRLWLECFRSGQISHQAIKRPTPSLFNMQYYGVFKGRQSELYLMTQMFYPPPPFLCLFALHMSSHVTNRSIVDLRETAKKQSDITMSMLAAHALTWIYTVGATFSARKKAALKALHRLNPGSLSIIGDP